jgi:ribosomal protein S19E (S16A)
MSAGSDNESGTLTHAAIWALERLAQQRYGRAAPALNWSVAQELRNAGFVSVPTQGRGGVSITRSGQDFLRARAKL